MTHVESEVERTEDCLARDVPTIGRQGKRPRPRGSAPRSRTKAALAVKKARDERVGGVPYGHAGRGDGNLVEEAAEQVIVARARELRPEGYSLRAIGRALIEEGRTPRTGGQWHVQVIARLLT